MLPSHQIEQKLMTRSNPNQSTQNTQNTQTQSSQNTPSLTRTIRPWLFEVEPYRDESFSHFLGRFRRANCLSGSHLSSMLGERSHVVTYWERPSRQRRPTLLQLHQLSQKSGVAIARLQQMWSSTLTASNIRYCSYPAVRDVSIPFD